MVNKTVCYFLRKTRTNPCISYLSLSLSLDIFVICIQYTLYVACVHECKCMHWRVCVCVCLCLLQHNYKWPSHVHSFHFIGTIRSLQENMMTRYARDCADCMQTTVIIWRWSLPDVKMIACPLHLFSQVLMLSHSVRYICHWFAKECASISSLHARWTCEIFPCANPMAPKASACFIQFSKLN